MGKKKKQVAEFRYYRMPEEKVFLALLGEKWIQTYGRDVDYLHYHNYLEIGYCYRGKGSMVLGEQEYRFGGNEFTVIPSNYLHTTNSDPGTISRWEYLFVDVEELVKKICTGNSGRGEKIVRLVNSQALFQKGERCPELVRVLRGIFDIMRAGEEFFEEEAEGLLFAFLTDIARRNAKRSDKKEGKMDEGKNQNQLVSRAIDFVSDHFAEQIRVEDIARYAHISETHLRRVFSNCMKMSPLDYVNLVRIQMACEYLNKTDESVAVIALKCGFTTNSTFNRNFRQIMGMTPVQWRKRPGNYEQQILKFEIHCEEGW